MTFEVKSLGLATISHQNAHLFLHTFARKGNRLPNFWQSVVQLRIQKQTYFVIRGLNTAFKLIQLGLNVHFQRPIAVLFFASKFFQFKFQVTFDTIDTFVKATHGPFDHLQEVFVHLIKVVQVFSDAK